MHSKASRWADLDDFDGVCAYAFRVLCIVTSSYPPLTQGQGHQARCSWHVDDGVRVHRVGNKGQERHKHCIGGEERKRSIGPSVHNIIQEVVLCSCLPYTWHFSGCINVMWLMARCPCCVGNTSALHIRTCPICWVNQEHTCRWAHRACTDMQTG